MKKEIPFSLLNEKNEKCVQVFDLVKNIIRKSYLIVEFGPNGAHKWLENTQFASVCTAQDRSGIVRFPFKIKDL